MERADQKSIVSQKRRKRRGLALALSCASASCLLAGNLANVRAETRSNPYVTQRAVSTPKIRDGAADKAGQSDLPTDVVALSSNKAESAAITGPVQSNGAFVERQEALPATRPTARPARLPAVKKDIAKVVVAKQSELRDQRLPSLSSARLAVELDGEVAKSEHTAALLSESKADPEELVASDYELPDLGTALDATTDPVAELAAPVSPPVRIGAVKNGASSVVLSKPTVVDLAPSVDPPVDPKRPIRPVEVKRSSQADSSPESLSPSFRSADPLVLSPAGFGSTAIESLQPSQSTEQQPILQRAQANHATRQAMPQSSRHSGSDLRASASQPKNWLPSTTSTSSQQDARRFLQQASAEYSRKAWVSAEASAWESLRCSASGIDIANRNASFGTPQTGIAALKDLEIAQNAIRESRDFGGKYGQLDPDAVQRIVLSHTTTALKGRSLRNISAIDAMDSYLNTARIHLARLAKVRVEAAQSLDLLAAIHLGRNDAPRLPSQTALCLRRAALQGQPGNGSLAGRLGMHLAAIGLDKEAHWALQHAYATEPTEEIAQALDLVSHRANDRAEAIRIVAQMQSRLPAGHEQNRGPVPTVVQLTPKQFASTSKSQHMAPQPVSMAPRPVSSATNHNVAIASPLAKRQATAPVAQTRATMSPTRSIQQTALTPPAQQHTIQSKPQSEPKAASSTLNEPEEAGSTNLLNDPAYFKTKAPKSKMRKMFDSVGKLW